MCILNCKQFGISPDPTELWEGGKTMMHPALFPLGIYSNPKSKNLSKSMRAFSLRKKKKQIKIKIKCQYLTCWKNENGACETFAFSPLPQL